MLALNAEEQKLVCDHLAHTFKVHDMYYRQQEAALSLAKVSRVLVAVESGHAAEFQDMKAKDIDVVGKFIFSKFATSHCFPSRHT